LALSNWAIAAARESYNRWIFRRTFELGRLSSGAAANLAGIPRTVFLTKLADYGVDTFRLTEAELAEDLANA
jgi:predicted HTH domain antitoxin